MICHKKFYVIRVLPTVDRCGRMHHPLKNPTTLMIPGPAPIVRDCACVCTRVLNRSRRCCCTSFSRGVTLQPSRNHLLNICAASQKSPRQTMERKMLKIPTNCQLIQIVTALSRAVQARPQISLGDSEKCGLSGGERAMAAVFKARWRYVINIVLEIQ